MASEIHAPVRVKLIHLESADHVFQAVIMDVEIDCPDCGAYGFSVAGHHLRAIKAGIERAERDWPGLCGSAVVGEVTEWSGDVEQAKKGRFN